MRRTAEQRRAYQRAALKRGLGSKRTAQRCAMDGSEVIQVQSPKTLFICNTPSTLATSQFALYQDRLVQRSWREAPRHACARQGWQLSNPSPIPLELTYSSCTIYLDHFAVRALPRPLSTAVLARSAQSSSLLYSVDVACPPSTHA